MLPSLTGLRLYAALMVFVTHFVLFKYTFNIQSGPLFLFFEGLGALGVSLFFVLSGFILCINYCGAKKGNFSIKGFYVARFARVYPVFLVTLLMGMPLFILSSQPKSLLGVLLPHLFLTHCFTSYACGTINPPAWSISNEFFFYLVFPLLFLFKKSQSLRFMILLTVVAALFPMLAAWYVPGKYWAHTTLPPNRLAEFLGGVATGLFYLKYADLALIQRGVVHRFFLPGLGLSAVGLVGLVQAQSFSDPYRAFYLFFIIPNCLLILVLALADRYKRSFVWLAHPWVVLGGEISYAFYLFHQIVMRYSRHVLFWLFHIDIQQWSLPALLLLGLVWLICSLLGAHALYEWVEKPCRKVLREKLMGKSPLSPDTIKPLRA